MRIGGVWQWYVGYVGWCGSGMWGYVGVALVCGDRWVWQWYVGIGEGGSGMWG